MLTRELVRASRTRAAIARQPARPRGPMPKYVPPDVIQDGYATRLRSMVGGAARAAYAPLLARLPALVAAALAIRGDAATEVRHDETALSASAAVREAEQRMGSSLRGKAEPEAKRASADVDDHNRVQLGRQVKAGAGIDLAGSARLKPIIERFVHDNVALVTGLSSKLAREVEDLVIDGLARGRLHESLAKDIQARIGVSESRAQLIAVDQVGKLNGQLNAQRQQDLGVTHFYWRTSEDARVRGNPAGKYPRAEPSHWARRNVRFAYADPPKGKNGEKELPGVPIRCRCTAEPDLEQLRAQNAENDNNAEGALAPALDPDLEADARAQLAALEADAPLPAFDAGAVQRAIDAARAQAAEAIAAAGAPPVAAAAPAPIAGNEDLVQAAKRKLRRGEPLNGHERIALFEAESAANALAVVREGPPGAPLGVWPPALAGVAPLPLEPPQPPAPPPPSPPSSPSSSSTPDDASIAALLARALQTTPPLPSAHAAEVVAGGAPSISPAVAARIEAHDDLPVVQQIATSPVETKTRMKDLGESEGVNASFKVTFRNPDGSTTVGIWKPTPTEAMRDSIDPAKEPHRERAASLLAEQLGVRDIYPPATLREIDGELGSVQAWAHGSTKTPTAALNGDAMERMRVFDFIIGNTDRHNGNVLWRGGTPVMIDHGLTFPSGPPERFLQPVNHAYPTPPGELSPALVRRIEALDEPAIVETLRAAELDDVAIKHTLYRVRALKQDPQILEARTRMLDDCQRWEDHAIGAKYALSRADIAEIDAMLRSKPKGSP